MRMVTKKFYGKRLSLVMTGLAIGGAAFALSPAFSGIKSALQGLENADPDSKCQQYQNDLQKKQKCDQCAKAVNDQKKQVKSAEKAAETKDQQLEAQATSAAKSAGAGAAKTERGSMGSDQANKAAGKAAKQGQAQNFGNLAQALNKCKQQIENACQGEMEEVGSDAKQACESAAKQAQAAQAQSAGDAEKMAQDEKKNDQNGQGMQPPQMPQMPQQQDKPSNVASNTNTSTATSVGSSSLSGNQLANQKVGIGGGEKTTDPTTASNTGYGGRSFGTSGISTGNDPQFNGAGNFGSGSGGKYGSSGSSSMGSLGGGSSSDGGGNGAAQAAAASVPQKQEDIEAFSNGGARPSYLGMKSKGGELSDLGLDGSGTTPAADAGADGDRSVASTEQGAGIHGEDEMGGSLFNMIHTRMEEIGRRGAI